jgi:UrcA family protein
MSTKVRIWIYAAVLVTAAACRDDALAAASKVPPAGDVGQITVRFGDLNLDQPAGAAILYRRIRHAAEQVCGDPVSPGSLIPSQFWRSCVAQAIERSVIAVDRPALTAYYRGQVTPSDQKMLEVLAASPKSKRGE